MPHAPVLPRLYAILDVTLAQVSGHEPRALLDAWLDAGVRLIQLRAKSLGSGAMLQLATWASARAAAAGAIFIVNDRADIGRLSGAAGVHVGQDDLDPADARVIVGPDAIVGISTHTTAQVERALSSPASYIAIGPVYATRSKGALVDPAVGLAGVEAAAALTRPAGRPLVAIGGITIENARGVIDAGAGSVAVISGLLGGDPAERARAFLAALA